VLGAYVDEVVIGIREGVTATIDVAYSKRGDG
jgi:hypothetical protein